MALVQWNLATGRTHQIRVHAQHIGHPLFGDPDYGGASGASVFALSGNNMPRCGAVHTCGKALHPLITQPPKYIRVVRLLRRRMNELHLIGELGRPALTRASELCGQTHNSPFSCSTGAWKVMHLLADLGRPSLTPRATNASGARQNFQPPAHLDISSFLTGG